MVESHTLSRSARVVVIVALLLLVLVLGQAQVLVVQVKSPRRVRLCGTS